MALKFFSSRKRDIKVAPLRALNRVSQKLFVMRGLRWSIEGLGLAARTRHILHSFSVDAGDGSYVAFTEAQSEAQSEILEVVRVDLMSGEARGPVVSH